MTRKHLIPAHERLRDLREEATDADWRGDYRRAKSLWDEHDRLTKSGARFVPLF